MKSFKFNSSISSSLLSTFALALAVSGCGGEEGKPVSTPNVPKAVREKADEAKEVIKEKVGEVKETVKEKVGEAKETIKGKTEEAKKVVNEKVDAAKEAAKDALKKN